MLLTIGLDGATWDLLDPWMAAGRLPNLARLRGAGWFGPLRSTIPPATLPSWTTFMTGVNPGKHGIFDFTRREIGSYDIRFVNATLRKAPTVWQLMSAAGRRVCVLGLPGTYPPEELNGCMVSGFDTPVTTRADASFVSPRTLAPLVMRLGGFPFADFQEFRVGPRWYQHALDSLLRGIEIKTRLAHTLLLREEWDCFLLLFGESDTVAHHFWKFHDPQSPRFDAEGAIGLGDAIRQVYAIGTLTNAIPDADVLIASDHGFGGAGKKVVYLNRWLQQCQLQGATRRGGRSRLARRAKGWALRAIPAAAQARAFRLNGGRWANRLESRARFAGIDWEKTRAFSEELNYFPSVWLNVAGREPLGTIDPSDYERVRDDVCAALSELTDPENGQPIVRRTWRREELYSGPWIQYAPDIVIEFNLDGHYSYNCSPTALANSHAVDAQTGPDAGGKLSGMNGSHRPDGVFLLKTGPVPVGRRIDGVGIADMAPTIMRLCGVKPPADFDGRTLNCVVSPIQYPLGPVAGGNHGERMYGDTEEREIAARLSALGYLQ